MKFNTILIIAFLLCSFTLSAQDNLHLAEFNLLPNFLITILAGVLLSFGFQFLLTALSVALGVTSTDNLKEEWVENKYNVDEDDDNENENEYNVSSGTSIGVKITSALGIWNILTVAPSLFAGTFLALMLTPIANQMVNITLALVIWATFFMLLFYLESRMIGTLIGGLINTAVVGLKSTGSAIQSLITPSPQSQIQNVANNTIEKIRQEMSSSFDSDSIVNTLDKYVKQIGNKMPEYDTLKNDLMEIAESSSSNSSNSNSAAKWTAIQTTIQTAIESDKNKLTEKGKNKAKQLNGLLAEMKAAYNDADSPKEGVQNVLAASPVDEEKVNGYVTKIQNFLQSTTPDNMELGTMKKELNKILDDPSKAVSGLREKMNELDRDAVLKLLAKNTSLDQSQIDTYAERAEGLLNQAKEKLNLDQVDFSIDNLMKRFEGNVANFINSTDDARLDYTALKNDFTKAINNPSESLNIVKRRLNTFDRDTLTSIITNTGLVSRANINDVVQSVEDARNEVAEQVKDIESTARKSMKNMERKAVIQAEHARKFAISAAWWLVATIVIAAGAAVAGAFVAV